jgi:hypothetical protein
MIIRIKKKTLEEGILSVFGLLIIIAILIGVSFTTNYVTGEVQNQTNATVFAILNVTNTEPNITSVVLDDLDDSTANEIDLTANAITAVYCNATVFDFNGWQDIDSDSVNATIYVTTEGINGDADNNHRYINSSCGSCVQGSSSTEAICNCKFPVQYYANATEWTCNISITDSGGTGRGTPGADYLNFTATGTDTATITKLLALDTPTTVLDYGNLSVTETSAAIVRNVTNVGNIDFNLTFRGYGSDNESIGQNVTMICELGNITFGNQRYVIGNNVTFDAMRNLTNQTLDSNFTLSQKTDDNNLGLEFNKTFWRLQIPLSVGGICNGTIIFGAVEAT